MRSKLILLVIGKLILKKRICAIAHKNHLQQTIKKLYLLYFLKKKAEQVGKPITPRRFWVRNILEEDQRILQGASNNLIPEMYTKDPDKFFNFVRVTREMFDELLILVAPRLIKQDFIRTAISPKTRLEVTLRYLASGDSMASVGYLFRIAPNTVSKIISETCQAIWDCLKINVFPELSVENWQRIATDFEEKWNFKNCVGAIDGKQVPMQALPNSGSKYYNYKGSHSINLLAIADAHYRFIMVDIGAEGRMSDSGVFKASAIGQGFEQKTFNLPAPKDGLPYVLVGDEAFQLTEYMMRPYPRSGAPDMQKKVFNYRLSRARRVVENSFGLLVSRWRIFRKPIIACEMTIKRIVMACVCLQNYILMKDPLQANEWFSLSKNNDGSRNIAESNCLLDIARTGSNTFSRNAANIRDEFCHYFCTTGAVEWQWEKALENDF